MLRVRKIFFYRRLRPGKPDSARIAAPAIVPVIGNGMPAATADSFDGGKASDPAPLSAAPAPAPAIGPISAPDGRMWIVVDASGHAERTKISAAGLAIEEVDGETVSGVASRNALQRLGDM